MSRTRKLTWERRSNRLWVAEHDGRTFRIERAGMSRQVSGMVALKEVDRLQRPIRSEYAPTFPQATDIAEDWLN